MPPSDRPHILFLLSSPLTADPVAVDRALRKLHDALRDIRAPATFVTRIAEAEAVGSYLARKDRPRFSVLHYLGHGYKPGEVPEGYLIFEDQAGDVRPLKDDQLFLTLNPTGRHEPEFRLAVVMACHSESVAAALHALKIPHIVAVDAGETVAPRAAITFFCRFYGALLTGNTVAGAFRAGQNAVALDEDLNRRGEAVALAETRKFRLLPEDGDHDQVLWPALPEGKVEIEPLPALIDPPFHLRPARFVGRGGEMWDILAWLRKKRAVLLQGVSGVGKTELAKEVARWLFARRRIGRVAFADLSRAYDSDAARTAVAAALGFSARPPPHPGRGGERRPPRRPGLPRPPGGAGRRPILPLHHRDLPGGCGERPLPPLRPPAPLPGGRPDPLPRRGPCNGGRMGTDGGRRPAGTPALHRPPPPGGGAGGQGLAALP